ncbi:MAG: Gfo/Idh/MocA family oxidoreductase [Phaeodactylibacter sp.]|nr:Gfo/Idh/MocA family oxidoreductase [Phaeodactylibacter sp.]MCB9295112.1 Gfo/Idh/MocA family oxidoreductase [Lewinellaceae bacterium]
MATPTTTRRQFIHTLSLGAGALMLPNILCRPQKDRLGIALVGLGYYSTDLLAPALRQTRHCYLAGIVTGSPGKIPVWQKEYGIPDRNVYDYENFDRIADNPEIDIVYVVLPTSMHSEYCVRAANAGKHVFCEKPMARTVAECEAAIRACRYNRVSLAVGYRMQHEPNTQELIRIGREQVFGRPTLVKASAGYYDGRSDHWKQKKAMGGGAMYDMGVYPLNAARYCTGEEPIAVTARHSTKRPEIYTEVDETTHFELEFPGGARAECATSLGMSMNDLRVDYENGWAELSPFQSYSGIRGEASDGRRFDARIPNQQARQMDDDALAIMEGRPMLVPGEEGLRDIRVVEAVYEAARTDTRVEIR